MSDLLRVYDVTCPANTPITAPVEVPCIIAGAYLVRKVRIVIPAGHAGLTGIALAYGHQAVIPSNVNAYISGDDEIFDYELGDYPPGVAWSVFLVNSDYISHAWETRWSLDMLANGLPTPAVTPVSVQDIYSATGQDQTVTSDATS